VTTLDIKGNKYSFRKLSTFQVWELARLLRDVIQSLAIMRSVANDPKLPEGAVKPDRRAYITTTLALFGDLPKTANDAALAVCLGSIQRDQGKDGGVGWADIYAAGRLMFDDIDIADVAEMVFQVIEDNRIIDFFSAPVSNTGATVQK
jgi:hypothetical protein